MRTHDPNTAHKDKWGIPTLNEYVREQCAKGVSLPKAISEYQTLAHEHYKALGIVA